MEIEMRDYSHFAITGSELKELDTPRFIIKASSANNEQVIVCGTQMNDWVFWQKVAGTFNAATAEKLLETLSITYPEKAFGIFDRQILELELQSDGGNG